MARPEDRASLVGLTRWSGLRRSTTSHILPDGEVRWISQKYSQAQNACPPTKTALLVRKLAWRAFHFGKGSGINILDEALSIRWDFSWINKKEG